MKKIFLVLIILPVFTKAQTINLYAGIGSPGHSGDGSAATAAQLYNPIGLAVDNKGNLLIADNANNCIRSINRVGVISTIAGTGVVGFSGDGGPAISAKIGAPTCVAADGLGNIYIVNGLYNRIRKIDASGVITTIAGNGTIGYSGDGNPATAAQLHSPWGITVDPAGNVFFSDQTNNCIRKISIAGIITTIAGSSTAGFSGDGGMATNALLNNPSGLTFDCGGNLYIADQFNSRIRKVDPSGIITTFAGNGTSGFFGDGGPATAAELKVPMQICSDGNNNIYIADANNYRVREIISTTGIIKTIAGNGSFGTSGLGGPATAASINYPMGVWVDNKFNIYVSDHFGNHIESIASSGISAGTITGVDSLCPNDSVTLTVSGGMAGGSWTSSNTVVATVTSTGKVHGLTAGTCTIKYSVSTGICSGDTSFLSVHVLSHSFCNASVNDINSVSPSSIYPNPATDELTVTCIDKIFKIEIGSLLGHFSHSYACNADKVQLNVRDLPSGMYFIRINGTEMRKFMKQ